MIEMNDQRLAELLRYADGVDPSMSVRDASAIATNARSIRRQRQQRARLVTATFSMLVVVGSVASMVSWRNVPHRQPLAPNPSIALREQIDRLDDEADQRMGAIQAVARSTKPLATKAAKSKTPARDFTIELDIQRERAAAIILQAADQLRGAGRSEFANDRYHDLISLFPDTAAARIAHERIEQMKNRT
jgi:hypothetical protein